MNTTETQAVHGALAESYAGEGGGHVAEAIGAIAAVILAVIGLAGMLSTLLAGIATIVIGAGILAEGWSSSGTSRQLSTTTGSTSAQLTGGHTGLTAGFLGGMAGIVLGILGLFRGKLDSTALLSVALLVYGATLVLSSFSVSTASWRSSAYASVGAPGSVASAMPVAHSGYLLVGLGAVVLGILAVVGLAANTLILVGMLSLGAVLLLGQVRFP